MPSVPPLPPPSPIRPQQLPAYNVCVPGQRTCNCTAAPNHTAQQSGSPRLSSPGTLAAQVSARFPTNPPRAPPFPPATGQPRGQGGAHQIDEGGARPHHAARQEHLPCPQRLADEHGGRRRVRCASAGRPHTATARAGREAWRGRVCARGPVARPAGTGSQTDLQAPRTLAPHTRAPQVMTTFAAPWWPGRCWAPTRCAAGRSLRGRGGATTKGTVS